MRGPFRLSALFQLLTQFSSGDYCDVYLTHDSMSVRKAHNSGRNHLRNVVDYYQRESSSSSSSNNTATRASSSAAAALSPYNRYNRGGREGGYGRPYARHSNYNYGRASSNRRPFRQTEIGHEKAQSVIDSITSSYAAEGQAHANPMLPHNQPGYAAAQARFGGAGRPAFMNGGGPPGGPRGMPMPPSFGGAGGPPGAPGAAPGAPGAPGVGGLPMPPPFNFPGGIPPPIPGSGLPPPPGSAAFGGGAPGGPGGGRGFPIPPPPMFGANGAPGGVPPPGAPNGMPFPFPIPLPGQPGAPPPNFAGFPAGMPIPVPGQPGFPPMPPPQFMQGGPPGGDRR